MPRPPNQQVRIQDAVRRRIDRGELLEGSQLPPMRQLAAQFGVSINTVKLALDRLALDGTLTQEHGRGVFVTKAMKPTAMRDAVVICMPMDDHVWGGLCMNLVYQFSQMGLVPHVLDSRSDRRDQLLRNFALSGARFLVVLGNLQALEPLVRESLFQDRHIISVVTWDFGPLPENVHLIGCDQAQAGRQVARHLHEAGHEHVLFLGTILAMRRLNGEMPVIEGRAERTFVEDWRRMGKRLSCSTFHSQERESSYLDRRAFLEAFREPSPPTAIFAQMDIGAWLAQRLILDELPEFESRVEIIGFGDTPWSHAAYRGISSVNLQLPLVAEQTCDLVRRLRLGEHVDRESALIPCRLVLRDTSRLGVGRVAPSSAAWVPPSGAQTAHQPPEQGELK